MKSVSLRVSLALYVLAIVGASLLLVIEPNNFDVTSIILPLLLVLFLSSLSIGYKFASTNKSKAIVITGTIALALLLTFIGFFAVAAVGWFVAVSHT